MPAASYLLLSLTDPRPPASDPPCLNSAGRWAFHGSAQSPLLAWRAEDGAAAQAAAERASRARGRAVQALPRADASWLEGREILIFSELLEPALLGCAPHSAAKARRLRNEADKLEAFSMVVRAASEAADHDAFTEVSRAATTALRAKFGGGSITSAFAWLAGRFGQEALESVLTGEVDLEGPLSVQQVVAAVTLARRAELHGAGA
ncbi:hypothetical protein [Variovorax saccharolyticus]|uniref:hypothetical protein n=1 Tax=Variovorax saccharolyticus TaxID=3053516 RepID=UPI002576710D|nr:hypothetical protein [Variovorax sp. J22R187]MDM0022076.1 hypothetical protein [Variovorax sp. J22R187]